MDPVAELERLRQLGAFLVFVAVTWGLKLLRDHWMSQVQDIVKGLETPPRGR